MEPESHLATVHEVPMPDTLQTRPLHPNAQDAAWTAAVTPGSRLQDRYEVIEAVSSGGSATIYRARDLRLGRDVAVKLMDPDRLGLWGRERLFTEARLMAKLRHPNLVPIYDVGEHQGATFLVMPYLAGNDVAKWARAQAEAPISADRAAEILDDACRGAAALHAAGVIHYDITPRNLLFTGEHEVAIADLGLAQPAAAAGMSDGVVMGTPGFVAPEVLAGAHVPPSLRDRADVYALGVTAYWLLGGGIPTRHEDGRMPRLSRHCPSRGTDYDEVLLAATAASPGERPTAEEFRARLFDAIHRSRPGSGSRGVGGRVLIVDDDVMIRALVTEVVRSALPAAAVETAADGERAMAMLRSFRPTLVVSDLDMPGADGHALVERIRLEPNTADAAIVIVTGVGSASDWQALREAGATKFLMKPVDEDLLHDTLLRLHREPSPGGLTEDGRANPPAVSSSRGFEGAPIPALGEVIDERYELTDRLGEGGMGVVFVARDRRLGRDVAIKIVHPSVADAAAQRRFLDEARVMASVRHPNVVGVHDFGEFRGSPYMVMEYRRGVSLEAWVAGCGGAPLEIGAALDLVDLVAAGVTALHDLGVVHHDIKPANILVSGRFDVAVADLGLASRPDQHDGPVAAGTPGYAAPEIIAREDVPAQYADRADVYALGMIAYWLLTGASPVAALDTSAILERQLQGDTPPPTALRPDLPPALDVPLQAAVTRDPRARPTVHQFRHDLRTIGDELRRRRVSIPPYVLIAERDPRVATVVEQVVRTVLPEVSIDAVSGLPYVLEFAQHRHPTLVVADLGGLVGEVSWIEALRADPGLRQVPIIVVTDNDGATDWTSLARMGADVLLPRPISRSQLGDAVRRLHGLVPNVSA